MAAQKVAEITAEKVIEVEDLDDNVSESTERSMATQSSETHEVPKKEVSENAQTSENEHKKAFQEWAEAMKQKK